LVKAGESQPYSSNASSNLLSSPWPARRPRCDDLCDFASLLACQQTRTSIFIIAAIMQTAFGGNLHASSRQNLSVEVNRRYCERVTSASCILSSSKLGRHVEGGYVVRLFVQNAWRLGYVTDQAERRGTNFARPLRNIVRGRKALLGLLVKQTSQ
jgi:hypothetical protein